MPALKGKFAIPPGQFGGRQRYDQIQLVNDGLIRTVFAGIRGLRNIELFDTFVKKKVKKEQRLLRITPGTFRISLGGQFARHGQRMTHERQETLRAGFWDERFF